MTNVGKLEHIISIVQKYEDNIYKAEVAYAEAWGLYAMSTQEITPGENAPQKPSKHSIEAQATTALERIKGFLDEPTKHTITIELTEHDIELFKEMISSDDCEPIVWSYTTDTEIPVEVNFVKD